MNYENLPSISECDNFLRGQKLPYGKLVREQVNIVLDQIRNDISKNSGEFIFEENNEILEMIAEKVRNHIPSMQKVINATGSIRG